MTEQDDSLELASRAFSLFTRSEQLRALEKFAILRYPSAADRFFEAVHFVIREARDPLPADPEGGP